MKYIVEFKIKDSTHTMASTKKLSKEQFKSYIEKSLKTTVEIVEIRDRNDEETDFIKLLKSNIRV